MIHRFGISEGLNDETFSSVLESFRSDIDQRHSPVALHDNDSNDIRMARQLADEIINTSGAEVKVYIRTDNADYDVVWEEDADPTYWQPKLLKGYYKPKPIEVELKRWGVDNSNKTDIVFSHRQLFEMLGSRMLRAGDVIQLPYNSVPINLQNYRVLNASPSGNYRYVWLYFSCQLELLTADVTVRPDGDMPIDEDPNSGGVYRESL